MRILLLSEQFPPTHGGVATSAARIARNLGQVGADVRVLTFDDSRPPASASYVEESVEDGVPIDRIGPFFLEQPKDALAPINERERAALRRQWFDMALQILNHNRPDCVLSFFLVNAGVMGQLLASALSVPNIACARGNDVGESIFRFDRLELVDWIISRADAVTCVNKHIRARLLSACPEAAVKTHVIPNSATVALSDIEPVDARTRTGWPAGAFVLAFVGSMRQKKGGAVLMRALRLLEDVDVRLLVIGPDLDVADEFWFGRDWHALREEDRLFVTGALPRSSVPRWLSGADAVVMPSVDDGMANGVLEGMALGICPLVSDVFADVVDDGVDGLVVRRDDPVALSRGIHALATEPALRREMGARARRKCEGWSPHDEARAYLALAVEVIGRRPQTTPPADHLRALRMV